MGIALIMLMAGFIKICSVHTPSSNPKLPPPKPLPGTEPPVFRSLQYPRMVSTWADHTNVRTFDGILCDWKNSHNNRGYTINCRLLLGQLFFCLFFKVLFMVFFSGTLKRRRQQPTNQQQQGQWRYRQPRENYQMGQMRRWGTLPWFFFVPSKGALHSKELPLILKNSQNLLKDLRFHRPKPKVFWRPVEPNELSTWALSLVSSGSHSFYRKQSSMRDSRRNSLLSAKWS